MIDCVCLLLGFDSSLFHHLLDDLAQVYIDPLLNFETQTQLHFEAEVCTIVLHLVFLCVRFVGDGYVDEPIHVGALRPLIQYGVENVPINRFCILIARQEDQVIRIYRQGIIFLQFFELADEVRHRVFQSL